jgi:micrococcal nuclease
MIGLIALMMSASGGQPAKQAAHSSNGKVRLDGVIVDVYWDDGDTFKVVSTGQSARLVGYNTLESYGPVHKFGPGPSSLFEVARTATLMAKESVWECSSQEGSGGYGRSVVDCPGLRTALLRAGLAHAFSVSGPAPKADLEAQSQGIAAKVGMWAQGAPSSIVTSAHSIDEKPGQTETYNRVLDVATGHAPKQAHSNTYAACTWACVSDSCLLYVPYSQRYGTGRADCIENQK